MWAIIPDAPTLADVSAASGWQNSATRNRLTQPIARGLRERLAQLLADAIFDGVLDRRASPCVAIRSSPLVGVPMGIRQHPLAHLAARLASLLELQQAAGMVGPQLPATGKRKPPCLATRHRDTHPFVSLNRSLAWHPGAKVGLRSPSAPLPKVQHADARPAHCRLASLSNTLSSG
jgi:hypothetical protein